VVPQLHAHAGDQLVERERLGEVVARPEAEPAQLRGQVGAGRDDEHRQVGPLRVQLPQHREPVEAREQEVEDDRVAVSCQRPAQAFRAVPCALDAEALGLETSGQEREDARLVLDDQDLHCRRATLTLMTRK